MSKTLDGLNKQIKGLPKQEREILAGVVNVLKSHEKKLDRLAPLIEKMIHQQTKIGKLQATIMSLVQGEIGKRKGKR